MNNLLRYLPHDIFLGLGGALSNVILDASGEKWGVVFQADEDATITHVGFVINSSENAPTYKIGLQGVGATGFPDGTYKGGGSPASTTFNPTSLGWTTRDAHWIALDNALAVSRGEYLALVIEYSSGTIDSTHDMTVCNRSNVVSSQGPYPLFHNGSAWAKATASPCWGYKSASRPYGMLYIDTIDPSLTSDGHRAVAKITLPTWMGNTYKIRGFDATVEWGSAGDFIAGLWAANGDVLSSITISTAKMNDGGFNQANGRFLFSGTLPELSFGSIYYIGLQRSGVNIGFRNSCMLAESNDLKMFAGESNFMYSQWDGSVWTDTDTMFVPVVLLLEDVTAPEAGGGGRRRRLITVS